mmetsp:Transcript_22484/g.60295  ORF Transcript_22484/g.60295 Transcript_22484/m.60295 type:complete len:380 (-) Transcript_22484:113-1252(-)
MRLSMSRSRRAGLLAAVAVAIRRRRHKIGRSVARRGHTAAQAGALQHRGVGQHEGGHALDERWRPRQHARVVAPLGLEHDIAAVVRGRVLRLANGGHGLDGHTKVDVSSRRDAAESAARKIGLERERGAVGLRDRSGATRRNERVIVRRSAHAGAAEAGAKLEAFGRGQREHRVRQLCLEPIEDWLAERRRHLAADARDGASDGVLVRLDLPDQGGHLARRRRVRAAQRQQLIAPPLVEVGHGRDRLAGMVVELARVVLVARGLKQCLERGAALRQYLEERILRRVLRRGERLLARSLVAARRGRLVMIRVAQQPQRAELVHLLARPAATTGTHRDDALRHLHVANRAHPAAHLAAVRLLEPLLRDRARGDAADRLARR